MRYIFLALFNDAVPTKHIIKHEMKIIINGRFQMMGQEEVVVYVSYIIVIYSRCNEEHSRNNNRSTRPPEQEPQHCDVRLKNFKELIFCLARQMARTFWFTRHFMLQPQWRQWNLWFYITPLSCIENTVFWYVVPCSSVVIYQRFLGSE
jgi:hypothetical protein